MAAEKIKYIYILSQRYSGSTLLSFLLATHPSISTIGERRKFYNKSIKSDAFAHHRGTLCSCGNTYKSCPYFNQIKQGLLEKVDPKLFTSNVTEFNISKNKRLNRFYQILIEKWVELKLPLSLLPFYAKVKQMNQVNQLLVEEILAIDGSSTFLDSSKSIEQIVWLHLIQKFDLYIIWLVRDPRAQVNSALKYNSSWNTDQAANYWKKEMIKNERILKKIGVKYIPLRYEDLCENPEQKLKDIFQFVGLTSDQFSLNFRNEERHIIGNGKMRLGKETKIVQRLEWKNQLSQEQIKVIENQTKDFRKFYNPEV